MLRIFFCGIVLASNLLSQAIAESDADFQTALQSLRGGKPAEALSQFQKLLEQDPESVSLLHNSALAAVEANQKPLAMGLWRKALALDPSFAPARQGQEYLESKFNMRPFEKEAVRLALHKSVSATPLHPLLWFLIAIFTAAAWLFLRAEERAPVSAWLLTGVFTLTLVFLALKVHDSQTTRGTIIVEKTKVLSLPAPESVQLLDLPGGAEVQVDRQVPGWVQIRTGDGSAGWVQAPEILLTQGY